MSRLTPPSQDVRPLPAGLALARLREGNARFAQEVTSMRARVTTSREWRARLAERQEPFATIVSCSDSRVPAEIVFDQGLGDLFIVRNAGAALGHAPLASVEFSVLKLDVRLVVVLAHERCGAFIAAAEEASGGPRTRSLGELLARLTPALEEAGPDGTLEERCERAAQVHARRAAATIARSPALAPLVDDGKLLVVPAYYRLAEGVVEFAESPCVLTASIPVAGAASGCRTCAQA